MKDEKKLLFIPRFKFLRNLHSLVACCHGKLALTKKMSDWNSDLDEVDFISELGSAETISSSSFSPGFNHDLNISILDYSMPVNVTQNLIRREVNSALKELT